MIDCRKCQRFSACYSDNDDCIGFMPKKQTNADRIRAMTDEELAKYLAWLEDPQACYEWELYGNMENISAWFDWLKKEVDDG